jgi:hypothetical protein
MRGEVIKVRNNNVSQIMKGICHGALEGVSNIFDSEKDHLI